MVNANGDTRPVHAHAVPARPFVPLIPVRRTDEAEPAQPEWNHRMADDAKERAAHGVRANVVCPGFARTPLADRQSPEQAKELGVTEEEVVRNVMLEQTVDGEISAVEDVAEAVLSFAASGSKALTGQSLVVGHGWSMQ